MGNVLLCCCKGEEDDHYDYYYPTSSRPPSPTPTSSLLRFQSPPAPVFSDSSLLRFQPPRAPASSSSSHLRFQSPPAPASRPERQLPHAPLPVPHGVAVASSSIRRSEPPPVPASRPKQPQQFAPPVTHGVGSSTPSVPASRAQRGLLRLEHDLRNLCDWTVPEGLEKHVTSSKQAKFLWYRKIFVLYHKTEPKPETAAEAAVLVATALSGIQRADLEGVLAFYGFPIPTPPDVTREHHPSSLPEGVKFVRNTLPVKSKCIGDGDGFTAYVDTADPMESKSVPLEVREAVTAMAQARKCRNEQKKNELRNKLNEAGYRIIYTSKDGILARQYRFRLRGIDAPEMGMQYGKESQNALVKLIAGKSVMVHVYGPDPYKRYVADVYCDGVFIQEQMLKNGHAWHYKNYDKRPDFAKWEKKARDARRGLWASDNPETPWDWKRNKRNAATTGGASVPPAGALARARRPADAAVEHEKIDDMSRFPHAFVHIPHLNS